MLFKVFKGNLDDEFAEKDGEGQIGDDFIHAESDWTTRQSFGLVHFVDETA